MLHMASFLHLYKVLSLRAWKGRPIITVVDAQLRESESDEREQELEDCKGFIDHRRILHERLLELSLQMISVNN